MRSHLAVYRAPDNANGCQFARYAIHASSASQQQQQQHQQHQPQQHQPQLQHQHQQQPPVWNNACYNLHQAHLHHGIYQTTGGAAVPPQLLVNQQRINECAGIPLISNACSHLTPAQRQRLLRKSTKNWPSSSSSAAAANGAHSTMSQLAAHAQGQPLLQQNSKQQQHQHALQLHLPHTHTQSWPAHATSYHPMRINSFQQLTTDKSRVLRYQNSAPAALNTEEQQKTQSNNSSNHNNTSVGQEAASSVTESCLPRIIKPRKRRKKDRKPANGVLLKMDVELQPKLQQQQQQQPTTGNTTGYTQLLPIVNNNNHNNMQQQHDHSHGVCFCRDCDPLRSLWDYPLRRSHSDASSGQGRSSCSTSSSDNSCASSICSQQVGCNTFDETTTTEHFAPITGDSSRAEIVGVIGSQRSHAHGHAHTTTTATSAAATTTTTAATLYLSDSSDSGYGDILSGMNIANDLFASCFGHVAAANASQTESTQATSAETLLNESINEISRKLIETCAVNEPNDNEGCGSNNSSNSSGRGSNSSGSSSNSGDSDSCSASASDSGLDSAGSYNSEALVFNFEHLNLTDTTPTAMDFLVDCNNNNNNNDSSNISGSCNSNNKAQQFYNNCFDLVWHSNNNNNNNCNRNNNNDSNQMATGKGGDSNATPTTLILGTVGKLKPAFSTIS